MAKRIIAAALAALTAASVSVCAFAADVTTENPIDTFYFQCENGLGEMNLTDEDYLAVFKSFYDYTGAGDVSVINTPVRVIDQNTKISMDWAHSELKEENLIGTQVYGAWYTRDENGDLIVETDNYGDPHIEQGGITHYYSPDGKTSSPCGGPFRVGWNVKEDEYCTLGSFSDPYGAMDYGTPDIYFVYLEYINDPADYVGNEIGYPDYNNMQWYFYCDILAPYKEGGIFDPATYSGSSEPADVEEPDAPVQPAETYELTADAPVSSEDFAALLEENKTKDVAVTADNVTFTFKAGTMAAVDGVEDYDFGSVVSTEFTGLDDPAESVTKDNFVLSIDYNYSGKLPAKADITINVGRKYAGKTLYYSRLVEDGITFIQSAVVDADGYITVTQDSCSTYVFTTENPAGGKGAPETGVGGIAAAIGAAVLVGGIAFVSRKRK